MEIWGRFAQISARAEGGSSARATAIVWCGGSEMVVVRGQGQFRTGHGQWSRHHVNSNKEMSRINHAPIVRSPDLEIHTSSPSHGQHSIHIGHPTPCPRFSQRVQSSLAHHLQPSTLKSQSLRRNPKSLSFCRLSENRPYDAIRSSAHRMSHPGLNHKNPQKQPLKKLPGLLVRRKSSRSVLRQSYDARPPLIPLNQVVPLSSERSSILLNFQKPTALLSVTHLFRILLIQRLRMVISAIKNPLHQNHSENRSQNQDR